MAGDSADAPADVDADAASGTRLAGPPENVIAVEGRIVEGTECAVIETAEGRRYAVGSGDAELATGDYVRIEGELADAAFCMEGEATIIPIRIDAVEPPA